MKPLGVIRPARTRGPWLVVVSDGGAILFTTHSWARAVEVAVNLAETIRWDHEIDGRAA